MEQTVKSTGVRAAGANDLTWVILLCFLLSGTSGLIYQVIWVRELELVFGTTTFAASTVLTAFMGGLALGSYYFGGRATIVRKPLVLYGFLELGIGAYGLAIPYLFSILPKIYEPFWLRLHLSFIFLTGVRFVLSALVLIVPTVLMGATLPVLSNFYAPGGHSIGLKVGWLYSINTFGAVGGAAAGGLALIPALGMRLSSFSAAAINLSLGFVALYVSRGKQPTRNERLLSESARAGAGPGAESPRGAGKLSKARSGKFAWVMRRLKTGSSGAGHTPFAGDGALGRRQAAVVLGAFAASGFVALCYEVIWSRVLTLIIGSSVYAFSIMLATFLIGLAVGSSIASRLADKTSRPILFFAMLELAIGVTSLGGAYLFNELPYAFMSLYRLLVGSNYAVMLLAQFLVVSLVMIVPTLLLGALFPLVIRIVHVQEPDAGDRHLSEHSGPSRTVGKVYAMNTTGAIGGAFASGFIMIPALGMLGSLRLAVSLNFVIAGALFLLYLKLIQAEKPPLAALNNMSRPKPRTQRVGSSSQKGGAQANAPARWQLSRWAAVSTAGVAAALFLIVCTALTSPPWDIALMSSAVYRYAPQYLKMNTKQLDDYFSESGQGKTIFYKEGITATVAVQQLGEGRVLKVNGKPDASTAGDLPSQVLIGSMPLLVKPSAEDCLVIGLGSGVTLGSVEQFAFKHVTCVELEPAVIQASHCFDDLNHHPLEDPRLSMITNDGRNYIETTRNRFDVIVSEPSNPWLTGATSLFTLDYFREGAQRLKDDGVFSQWLQIYEMAPRDVRSMIATFRAAFPYSYLFRGSVGDLMLLGSKRELNLDLDVLRERFSEPKVAADLERVHVKSPADLISRLYMGPAELARFASGAELNTDDNALIEFSAPRRVGVSEEDTVASNVKDLLRLAGSPLPYLAGDFENSPRATLPFKLAGEQEPGGPDSFLLDAALSAIKREETARAEQFVKYSLDTKDTARGHDLKGEILSARGDDQGSIDEWRQALILDPNYFYTLIDLGKYYLKKQDITGAVPYLDRAVEADPANARGHHLRGLAYQAAGDFDRAIQEYSKALPDAEYTKDIANFYLNYGTALVSAGDYQEAARMFEEHVHLHPEDFEGHYQLGAADEVLAERSVKDVYTADAISELKKALTAKPDYPMAHYYLSKAYRRLGMEAESEDEFALYERFLPK